MSIYFVNLSTSKLLPKDFLILKLKSCRLYGYMVYPIYSELQAHNSVGRVIALQAIGHRFKSGWAYKIKI